MTKHSLSLFPMVILPSETQEVTVQKIFDEELKRLRTDYVDYYLMHMFTDVSEWENLKALGIEDWIRDRKADGSIRNIGFSFHGNSDIFIKLLDVYDWETIMKEAALQSRALLFCCAWCDTCVALLTRNVSLA